MGFLVTLFAIGLLAAIAWVVIQHLVRLLVRLVKVTLGAIYGAVLAGLAASLTGQDLLLPILLGFMTGAWLAHLLTSTSQRDEPAAKPPHTAVREPKADREVADAWDKALAIAPREATAILKARTPCALLLARSASNDLDFPTIEVVQIIRRHVPELVDGHCGVIRTLDPTRRAAAIAEMIRDLTTIATMAQTRLDLIAARRREGLSVQRDHLQRRAAQVEFA